MIVTEQEARTKWCPHARVPGMHGVQSVNRQKEATRPFSAILPASCRCVASECMAWKWKQYHSPEEREARKPNGLAVETPLGYCGL